MASSSVVDLIEILDSDTDEEPTKTQNSREGLTESIDLCESSDEDGDKPNVVTKAASFSLASRKRPPPILHNPYAGNPYKTPKSLQHKAVGTAETSRDLSSDEDDDAFLLKGGPIFAVKTPKSVAQSTHSQPLSQASSTSSVIVNPYLKPAAFSQDTVTSLSQSVVKNPYRKTPPSEVAARPSTTTPYLQQPHSTTPNSAPFIYPTLLQHSKQYPDVRAQYALAYWKYGRTLTHMSHQRPRLDQAANKIVKLAIGEDFPIRSLDEYAHCKSGSAHGNNNRKMDILQELQEGRVDGITTPVTSPCVGRQYYTIAEACLVVVVRHFEQVVVRTNGTTQVTSDVVRQYATNKEAWITVSELIPQIDALLRPECPGRLTRVQDDDFGAQHYLQPSTRSIEFLQIVKLESTCFVDGACLKRHKYRGQTYYELRPRGWEVAQKVQNRVFPEPPGHYRCSRIATVGDVQEKYKGVCLGVDMREGGGGNKILHQKILNKLDMVHVPFMVGTFQIGDYVFFTRRPGAPESEPMNYLCPILVERKSAQDVAQSIADGRWKSQKRRMYVGQFVFGYDNCRMVYIIEGNEKAQVVTGNYVGARHFNVSKEQWEREIANLEAEGFEVMRTPREENSMFELARWAERISRDIASGALKAEFTYAEFKSKCSEIGNQVDFSRLAKEHYRQRKEELERMSGEVLELDNNDDEMVSDVTKPLSSKAKFSKLTAPNKKYKSSHASSDIARRYEGMTVKQLGEECTKLYLKKSGTRAELMDRLLDTAKHPPKILWQRKQTGNYTPDRHNVGACALLVALYLHEREVDDDGLTRDELYCKAESLHITKNPFSGGTTQTGPYHYDGFSNMKYLEKGDPALVIKKKQKYKLTRSSSLAGWSIAKAVHAWNHAYDNCPCGDPR